LIQRNCQSEDELATNQTWDQTYQSDKAQEEQLKKGGKSG
jgi:hypothetical protein